VDGRRDGWMDGRTDDVCYGTRMRAGFF